MAKIKDGLLGSVSGKLGPLVVVQRGDMSYVRAAPNYTKDSWSDRQLQHRQRFKAVSAFCKQYKQQFIIPIWNRLATNSSGYHLFMKANMPAFGRAGELEDPSMLHFADGTLPLPFKLTLVADPEQVDQLEVSWLNDEGLTGLRLSDELWYATVSADGFQGPFESGIHRSAQGGLIALPEESGLCEGVYLFFASPARDAFSPDCFLAI
ncbi:hypothetical protein [Sunxiuqinia sp. sy24]|uniref:hypothetical protein n=1 Tax=Sunxiuqinia sp. sy24 TaxID=3461495 RepID=UPI0040459C7E